MLNKSVAYLSMMLRQHLTGLYEESTIKDIYGIGYVQAVEDNLFIHAQNYPWFRDLTASSPADRRPCVVDELRVANAGGMGKSWQRVGGGFFHIRIDHKAALTLDEQMELAAVQDIGAVGDSWDSFGKDEAGAASQEAGEVAHERVAHHRKFGHHARGQPARLKRHQARHGDIEAEPIQMQ